jgi:hypothetical protein
MSTYRAKMAAPADRVRREWGDLEDLEVRMQWKDYLIVVAVDKTVGPAAKEVRAASVGTAAMEVTEETYSFRNLWRLFCLEYTRFRMAALPALADQADQAAPVAPVGKAEAEVLGVVAVDTDRKVRLA